MSPIVEYAELLKEHRDPKRKEVKDFLKQHDQDPVLHDRAQVLNKVFALGMLRDLRAEYGS